MTYRKSTASLRLVQKSVTLNDAETRINALLAFFSLSVLVQPVAVSYFSTFTEDSSWTLAFGDMEIDIFTLQRLHTAVERILSISSAFSLVLLGDVEETQLDKDTHFIILSNDTKIM